MVQGNPIYDHDCSQCVYLGSHFTDNTLYDLYFCSQALNHPTVIARYSNEDSGYMSSLHIARILDKEGDYQHPLAVARQQAIVHNLICN